ncbi:MAG: RNA 2',3'-cyclic phosphodiesterase [Bacillus sp. (in: Bacteria)]|nr:RNA 2',3'-cyclic phosphodiesterase [Bacillus sp. (in: firmicutes)]
MKKGHHFIGISIPREVKEELQQIQEVLDLKTYFNKVTYGADFHITLLFLGEWENRKKVHVWNGLQERLKNSDSFHLTLKDVGIFGNHHRPRVVWIGVEEEKRLSDLQYKIKEEAATFDFPFENRPFRPHITLGKSFKNKGLPAIEKIKVPKLQWEVKEIALFQIKPNNNPMYEAISKVSLSM